MTASTSPVERNELALTQLPSQTGDPDEPVALPLTLELEEPEPPQDVTSTAHSAVNQSRLIRVPLPVESLSS
jgi:hypothetical protein